VTAFENYASTHTLSASTLVPLNGQQQLVTNTVSPALEPASMALLATGALGLAAFRRRGQMRPLRAIR
jgi:PEP-CTERM motif